MGDIAIKDSKAYVAWLQDASRAIAEWRVTDLETAYARRGAKCKQGDDYSCGAQSALQTERLKIEAQTARIQAVQIEIGAKGCHTETVYQLENAARVCAAVLEYRHAQPSLHAKPSLVSGKFGLLDSSAPLLGKDQYRSVRAFDRCSRPVGFRIERYNPFDLSSFRTFSMLDGSPKFLDPSCFGPGILESLRIYGEGRGL
ncbi:MAG: hypothetical protein HYT77_01875 [Deltaproteobacteria bacterium]|nr:hypothetical protein [Deltaproteobacteria bacterium]